MPYYKRVIGRKGKSIGLRNNYTIIQSVNFFVI